MEWIFSRLPPLGGSTGGEGLRYPVHCNCCGAIGGTGGGAAH